MIFQYKNEGDIQEIRNQLGANKHGYYYIDFTKKNIEKENDLIKKVVVFRDLKFDINI